MPISSLSVEHVKVLHMFELLINPSVFEINGAHCARRAHFRRRAHVFLSCAPGVCTFFQSIIMAIL